MQGKGAGQRSVSTLCLQRMDSGWGILARSTLLLRTCGYFKCPEPLTPSPAVALLILQWHLGASILGGTGARECPKAVMAKLFQLSVIQAAHWVTHARDLPPHPRRSLPSVCWASRSYVSLHSCRLKVHPTPLPVALYLIPSYFLLGPCYFSIHQRVSSRTSEACKFV